jgi:hypothetical protein
MRTGTEGKKKRREEKKLNHEEHEGHEGRGELLLRVDTPTFDLGDAVKRLLNHRSRHRSGNNKFFSSFVLFVV